jgi:hypothetical protein
MSKKPRFSISAKLVYLYKSSIKYDTSWGNKDKIEVISDLSEFFKVIPSIKDPLKNLLQDLNLVGYSVYFKKGYIVDEGYGEPICPIPKLPQNIDVISYLMIVALMIYKLNQADIWIEDAYSETSSILFNLREIKDYNESQKIIDHLSGKEKPADWDKIVEKVLNYGL